MDGVCDYYITWCVFQLSLEGVEHSWEHTLSFLHSVLSLLG